MDSSYIPHFLFSGSIVISMYHHINRHLSYFADKCTRALHKVLPVHIQHTLRESGFIKYLNDYAVYSVGLAFAVSRPSLLVKHFHIGNQLDQVQYGKTKKHVFDVFRQTSKSNSNSDGLSSRATILFFVHGGAWGCGYPWQYRVVADGIGAVVEADFVVVLGFPTYPESSIIDQRECISEGLKRMHQTMCDLNASGVQYDVVLCGHSSGAASCALYIAEQIRRNLVIGSELDTEIWRRVKAFIGLSGPYDIVKHYEFEKARGVHEISPLKAAAGGLAGLASCSATLLLQQYAERLPLSFPIHLPYTILLHGTEDHVVPITSTEEYADALRKWGVAGELLRPRISHMEPLLDGAMYVEGGKNVTMQHLEAAWSNYRDVEKHLIL